MFDIGATELLLIAVVAILVIGPKDMPLALRTIGRWVGRLRKLSAQFRAGFDNIVREAELEEMEKKWKAQNEKIMAEHPDGIPADAVPAQMEPTGAYPPAISSEKRAELERIAAKERAAASAEEEARPAENSDAPTAQDAKTDPDAVKPGSDAAKPDADAAGKA